MKVYMIQADKCTNKKVSFQRDFFKKNKNKTVSPNDEFYEQHRDSLPVKIFKKGVDFISEIKHRVSGENENTREIREKQLVTKIKKRKGIEPELSKPPIVIPKSLLETFTDELSSIQKELDSSVNTKNMKFGDLIELVDKNLPYDDESIPLHLKQKFVKIENEAKEKNISFVTSPKFTCGQENLEQFIKEKMDYVQKLGGCISTNEATAIEALDWIEKNGVKGNYSIYKGVYGSLIDEVTASFRILKDDGRMTDKALNKYIGLYDKFAETPLKGDKWGDAVDLGKVFEENASLMSKETAFKFLDAIEKIAFRRLDVHVVKLYSEDLKLNLNPKDFEEFVSRIDKLENSFKKK